MFKIPQNAQLRGRSAWDAIEDRERNNENAKEKSCVVENTM